MEFKPSEYKILIVDDAIDNVMVVSEILKHRGYRLESAENGEAALKIIRGKDIDLILLDIMMPGLDGWEVSKLLQQDADLREIPIIFLTGQTDTKSIVKGFEYGAVDYVTRPFKAAELYARLKVHLELKAAIKEEKAAKEQLKGQYELLTAIGNEVLDPIVYEDAEKRFLGLNKAYEKTFGVRAEEIRGKTAEEIFPAKLAAELNKVAEQVVAEKEMQFCEIQLETLQREMRSFIVKAVPYCHGEQPVAGIIYVWQDITEKKKQGEALKFASGQLKETVNNDPLTGLFARRYFMEIFTRECKRALRYKTKLSLLVFDVDDFKTINDAYGQETGDYILSKIGERIRFALREVDFAGRLESDEFALLLPEIDEDGAVIAAKRIKNVLEENPFVVVSGEQIFVKVSFGVTIFQEEYDNFGEIILSAEKAVARAKKEDKRGIVFAKTDTQGQLSYSE